MRVRIGLRLNDCQCLNGRTPGRSAVRSRMAARTTIVVAPVISAEHVESIRSQTYARSSGLLCLPLALPLFPPPLATGMTSADDCALGSVSANSASDYGPGCRTPSLTAGADLLLSVRLSLLWSWCHSWWCLLWSWCHRWLLGWYC